MEYVAYRYGQSVEVTPNYALRMSTGSPVLGISACTHSTLGESEGSALTSPYYLGVALDPPIH